MVYIFYNRFLDKLEAKSYFDFLQQLPFFIREKISKFRRWQDAHRSLFGNILLLYALKSLNISDYSLNDLKYTEFQRPYFDDLIDFNISHSGEYTVCALSKTNRVGIDIEQIRDIPIEDYNGEFSNEEWKEVLFADNRLRRFYKFWTQKEAFMKALGVGLDFPLREVNVVDDKITWKDQQWFLYEIKLDEGYFCHLSTDMHMPDMTIKKIDFY